MRFADVLYPNPPSKVACVVCSPLPYRKTTPLAITTGSACHMLRESQACVSCGFPSFSSILNAATAPCATGPCSIGAVNCECFGPQNGTRTHRVPLDSSHVASAPQTPAPANCTSSLQMRGVRYSGVLWSSPPSALVSSSHTRHSLLV